MRARRWRNQFFTPCRNCRLADCCFGPAVSVERFVQAIKEENADLVGVSYRLTPETGERLLGEFAEAASELHESGVRFVFGGTPPVAQRAQTLGGFFEKFFDGSQPVDEVLAFLRGETRADDDALNYPQDLISRIAWKTPYPLLRHHFGLPTMEASLDGVAKIAEAKALDVISLGIDQDAQENFSIPSARTLARKALAAYRFVLNRITGTFLLPLAVGTSLSCEPTPARMTLSALPKCMLRRSTSPGAPSRFFGSTRWTDAVRSPCRSPSRSTKR